MADDEKVLRRIENLLRTAAPDSGAADNERITASCEAVRLIIKHSITLREPQAPRPQAIAKDAWVLNLAPSYCGCQICGKVISPRDAVWIRVLPSREIHYRHNYGACAVA